MRGPYGTRLYWTAVGGLAFWLPFILVSLVLGDKMNLCRKRCKELMDVHS